MTRRKKRARLKLKRGPILMVAAALWLGYRALTAPGDLAHVARLAVDSTPVKATPGDPVSALIEKPSALRDRMNGDTAALEDLGNPDGISRLPAGQTPTVDFHLLTPHCPSLASLESNAWIEIDELGHILSLELDSKGTPPNLGSCEFEPYRGPHGRPLAVRTHYIARK